MRAAIYETLEQRQRRLLNQRFPTFAEALAALIASYPEDGHGVRASILESQAQELRLSDPPP